MCCSLVLGDAIIEWKLRRVGAHNCRSQLRGSASSLKAPSLKASLKMLLIFLACRSNHWLAFDSRLNISWCSGSESSVFDLMKEKDGSLQVSSVTVLSLNELKCKTVLDLLNCMSI